MTDTEARATLDATAAEVVRMGTGAWARRFPSLAPTSAIYRDHGLAGRRTVYRDDLLPPDTVVLTSGGREVLRFVWPAPVGASTAP